MQLTTELDERAVTKLYVIRTSMALDTLYLITLLGLSVHMDSDRAFPYVFK